MRVKEGLTPALGFPPGVWRDRKGSRYRSFACILSPTPHWSHCFFTCGLQPHFLPRECGVSGLLSSTHTPPPEQVRGELSPQRSRQVGESACHPSPGDSSHVLRGPGSDRGCLTVRLWPLACGVRPAWCGPGIPCRAGETLPSRGSAGGGAGMGPDSLHPRPCSRRCSRWGPTLNAAGQAFLEGFLMPVSTLVSDMPSPLAASWAHTTQAGGGAEGLPPSPTPGL